MGYIFKIARRLARIRAWGLPAGMLVIAACNPDATTNPLIDGLEGPELKRGSEQYQLGIDPPSATVDVNQTVSFTAQLTTRTGDLVSTEVLWSASGGTISSSGRFSAGAPGTYTVYARTQKRRLADSATVTVRPLPVALTVNPDSAVLARGAKQAFVAYGLSDNDSTVAVQVTWRANGGTIDSTGLYVAPTVDGIYHVIARAADTRADTVPVRVTAPATATMTALVLTPDTASLATGATQSFTVLARLSDGTTGPATATYRATGGNITSAGLYTAGTTPGTYRVIATASNGMADSSRVVVTAAEATVTQVALTPASVSLDTGATRQFTATATLSDGSTAPATVTYNVTGGTISNVGLYKAGAAAGSFRVVATTANGKADTSSVTITVPTTALASVVLTPASATLAPGGTQQFAASGKASDGSTVPVTVTYAGTGGTVSGGGLYTAGSTSGSYRVIATAQGGLADTSAITITSTTGSTGEKAATADSFVNSVGVNVHLGYTDRNYYTAWSTITKPRILESGIKHLRDHASQPAIWWHNIIRDRANELATSGIRFSWISDPRMNTPQQAVDWAKATLAATQQVEGPNEWDLNSPNDGSWVPAHKAYLQDLWNRWNGDAATASRLVVGPSHFEADITPGLLGDVSMWLDQANLHPYPFPNPPELSGMLDWQWNSFKGIYGNKPTQSTETGYHTGGAGSDRPVSEAQHGKWIPRLLLHYFNRGLTRSYIYELLDQCTDAGNRECNFGLLRIDGSPKPAFTALKNLLALVSDPGPGFATGRLAYTLSGAPSSVHHTLLQKRDGRFYLLVWQAVNSTSTTVPVTLSFGSQVQGVRTYLPLNGSGPTQTVGATSSVNLQIPDHVMVVEVTP